MDSAAVSFIILTSSVRGGGAVSTSCHASSVVSGERETRVQGWIHLLLRWASKTGWNESLFESHLCFLWRSRKPFLFVWSSAQLWDCSSWVLWSRTRVQILKGTSEHFFSPSVHTNGCLMSLAGYPQGKATVSTSASDKSKGWFWFKEFKSNFNSVNLS